MAKPEPQDQERLLQHNEAAPGEPYDNPSNPPRQAPTLETDFPLAPLPPPRHHHPHPHPPTPPPRPPPTHRRHHRPRPPLLPPPPTLPPRPRRHRRSHPPRPEARHRSFLAHLRPRRFRSPQPPRLLSRPLSRPRPPTVEPGGFTLVDTSMAHQLHCLRSIMVAYGDLAATVHAAGHNRSGGMSIPMPMTTTTTTTTTTTEEAKPRHHDHSWHLGHCFDCIRQGIMCCGDTALEGAATTFPEGIKGSDGWNAKHVCKDYGDVKGWIIGMGVN